MVRKIKSPYLNIPQILDVDRSKVQPLVRNLFHFKVRQAPQAIRLKFHLKNWEKLTQDLNILSVAQSFKIPFSQINSKIKVILRTGAIQQVKSEPGEFLSNLFFVNK